MKGVIILLLAGSVMVGAACLGMLGNFILSWPLWRLLC